MSSAEQQPNRAGIIPQFAFVLVTCDDEDCLTRVGDVAHRDFAKARLIHSHMSEPRGRSRSRSPPPRGGGGGGGGKSTGVALPLEPEGLRLHQAADGGEDLFCHFSSITDGKMLKEGATVQFVKAYDERKGKDRADQVTGGCEEEESMRLAAAVAASRAHRRRARRRGSRSAGTRRASVSSSRTTAARTSSATSPRSRTATPCARAPPSTMSSSMTR